LAVAARPFDAVLCLFDSIGYVATNEALLHVLKGIHHHLRPGGLFIFEFWHAAAMLHHYDPIRLLRRETMWGEILRISETTLDCARQLGQVTYTLYDLRHDKTFSCLKETHINRYFLVQEMAGWLCACGFAPLKWFAGFTADEHITQETWHVVAVARRDSA
jgi:SAM-dependent methyltransferase